VISGFHHEVAENCALLGYYTASSSNCPKTSVRKYPTHHAITQKSAVLKLCYLFKFMQKGELTGNLLQVSLSLFFLSLGTEDILQKWIYSWHYVSSMFCHVHSYFSFLLS